MPLTIDLLLVLHDEVNRLPFKVLKRNFFKNRPVVLSEIANFSVKDQPSIFHFAFFKAVLFLTKVNPIVVGLFSQYCRLVLIVKGDGHARSRLEAEKVIDALSCLQPLMVNNRIKNVNHQTLL